MRSMMKGSNHQHIDPKMYFFFLQQHVAVDGRNGTEDSDSFVWEFSRLEVVL